MTKQLSMFDLMQSQTSPAPATPVASSNSLASARCMVIACGWEATEWLGAHLVCGRHQTEETRRILESGSWPAWYGYEGKWRVVPTVRRLDNLGHEWDGLGVDNKCSKCNLLHDHWVRDRFSAPCSDYALKAPIKGGLFRPPVVEETPE